MQPWAPAGRLRNYCTAAYPTSEVFSGTARTMTLNGVALSCDSGPPRAGPARDPAGRDHRWRRWPRPGTLARQEVIHLVRTPGTTLLVLAQQGRAAVFHAPTMAEALGLFAPAVRLPAPFRLDRVGPWS